MLDNDLDVNSDLGDLDIDHDSTEDDQDVNNGAEGDSDSKKVDIDDVLDKKDGKNKKEGDAGKVDESIIQAQKQEDAWVKNVVNGKKDLEDCPNWLRPRVEKRLGISKEGQAEIDLEKKITEKVLENQKFEELKKSIPKLTKDQAENLKKLYSDYHELGKFRALETAIRIMQLNTRNNDYSEARGSMSLPPSGQQSPRVKSYKGMRAVDCSDEISTKNYEKWKRNGFAVDPSNNPIF